MNKIYKIAGFIIGMDTYGRAESQAVPYMVDTDSNVDFYIEQAEYKADMQERNPSWDDESCEYLATGKSFYRKLLHYQGMGLHSSAIAYDGYAYLFSAPCGTGKSTHTCLWRRVFGDERVRILNDDKPALRYEDGTWYAYGTPWSGKTGQNMNLRFPLAGICFLERGLENKIMPLPSVQALYCVLNQTSRPKDAVLKEKLLKLATQLVAEIPIWRLECNMDSEAARVSYEAMSSRIKEK